MLRGSLGVRGSYLVTVMDILFIFRKPTFFLRHRFFLSSDHQEFTSKSRIWPKSAKICQKYEKIVPESSKPNRRTGHHVWDITSMSRPSRSLILLPHCIFWEKHWFLLMLFSIENMMFSIENIVFSIENMLFSIENIVDQSKPIHKKTKSYEPSMDEINTS